MGLAGAAVAAAPSQAQSVRPARPDLDSALERLSIALEKGDGSVLDQLLHPDLVYMHSSGFAQTKADLMRDIAGKQFFASFTASDIRIQRSGDTALTSMFVDQVKNIAGGRTRASRIRVIYTWIKHHHRWQLYGRCSALMLPAPNAACEPCREQ
jgi:ketosteroid isomerase-like protein